MFSVRFQFFQRVLRQVFIWMSTMRKNLKKAAQPLGKAGVYPNENICCTVLCVLKQSTFASEYYFCLFLLMSLLDLELWCSAIALLLLYQEKCCFLIIFLQLVSWFVIAPTNYSHLCPLLVLFSIFLGQDLYMGMSSEIC